MTAIERSDQGSPKESWFLKVISGRSMGQFNELHLGRVVYFGREAGLDWAFPHDMHMSRRHFSLECDGVAWKIRDLNSRNGTYVNGNRVQEAVLARNDLVTAGETTFILGFAHAALAHAPETGIDGAKGRLLSFLSDNFQPLFAILDAARDPYALALLVQSHAHYQSLYEGPKGESLSDVAPYLVQLPKDSDLLPTLVKEGWGQSWGVYLRCPAEFQEVRRHLRHFLEVRQPDGEQVYFRFYDPRVLRVYLANLRPDEAAPFMGPIHCYLMEDQTAGTLLQFMNAGQGVAKAAIPLTTLHPQTSQGNAATATQTYTAG